MYRTQARIVIQDERSTAVANLNATDPVYWQDPEPYFNTQYRILQSRGLARRVVRKLPPPPVPRAQHAQPSAVASTADGQSLADATPAAAPELPAADETVNELAAIGAFLGGVEILPVKGTRLVEIAYTSSDAQYAALAANTLAREYVQQNLDLKLANTTATINWLGEELGKQRDKVEAAERAMAEYQEGQNAMSLDDRQNIVIARLNSLNDAVTKAKTARLQKEAAYRQLGNLTRRQRGRGQLSDDRAELDHPGDQAAARPSEWREGEDVAALRSATSGDGADHEPDREQHGAAAGGNGEAARVDWKRLPGGDGGRAEPERVARRAEAARHRSESQEHHLQHPAARGGERAAGLQRAPPAGERAARRQQQPREQRAADGRRRSCRGARSRQTTAAIG